MDKRDLSRLSHWTTVGTASQKPKKTCSTEISFQSGYQNELSLAYLLHIMSSLVPRDLTLYLLSMCHQNWPETSLSEMSW